MVKPSRVDRPGKVCNYFLAEKVEINTQSFVAECQQRILSLDFISNNPGFLFYPLWQANPKQHSEW